MRSKQPLSVALDIWDAGSESPRGVVQLKRQYAKACAYLAKQKDIVLHYTGDNKDKQWLQKEGLLEENSFHRFRIPGKMQLPIAQLGFFPVHRFIGNPDIYHSFTLYPFRRGCMRVIGTLVDFVPMRIPEYSPLKAVKEQVIWCEWASRHHDEIWIAISGKVKQDAIALARLQENQVINIELCVDEDVYAIPSRMEVDKTLNILGVHRPYLLCVNTFNPRKNHLHLLHAWNAGGFAKRGWSLILAGHPAGNPLTNQISSGVYDGVLWLGYLQRQQLIHLYYGCEGLIYPSVYEGFGIPVAEAIVAGKAILTTHRSPMADIAKAGALTIDPLDLESIKNGLAAFIYDDRLRKQLASYNFTRRDLFLLSHMANILLSAYQKIT